MPEECFNKNTCSNKCKEEKSEKGKLNMKKGWLTGEDFNK